MIYTENNRLIIQLFFIFSGNRSETAALYFCEIILNLKFDSGRELDRESDLRTEVPTFSMNLLLLIHKQLLNKNPQRASFSDFLFKLLFAYRIRTFLRTKSVSQTFFMLWPISQNNDV